MKSGRSDGIDLRWALRFGIFAALAIRIGLVCLPEGFLANIAGDDMFYYLEAARRTDSGWPSMDGVEPTSGWHPLYMGLALLAHEVDRASGISPIHTLTFLNTILGLMALFGVLRALRAIAPGSTVNLVAVVLLLNPTWTAHGLCGVENMLSAAVVSGLFARRLRRLARNEPTSMKAAVADGLLLGIAGLARTDNVLVAAGWGIAALVAPAGGRRPAESIAILGTAAVALAVVAPWLGLLQAHQGSLVQDSAVALLARSKAEAPNLAAWGAQMTKFALFWVYRLGYALVALPLTGYLLGLLCSGKTGSLRRLTALRGLLLTGGISLGMLLVVPNTLADIRDLRALVLELGVFLAAAGLGFRAPMHRLGLPSGWRVTLFLPLLLLLSYYVLVFQHFQVWYTTTSVLLLLFAFSVVLARVLETAKPGATGALILVLVVAFAVGTARHVRIPNSDATSPWDHLASKYATCFPGGEHRVGSFDSGRLSWELHPIPITNLDGVMNHAAAMALKKGTYPEYLQRAGIEYVISDRERIAHFASIGGFEWEEDRARSGCLGLGVFRIRGPRTVP